MKWREDLQRNPAEDPCLERINMLAHSMGNRVLRETLWAWDKYDLPGGVPLIFRNTDWWRRTSRTNRYTGGRPAS